MREYTRSVLLDKNTSLDINNVSNCGGLYIFLTGGTEKKSFKIGKSRNLKNRLKQHCYDKKGDMRLIALLYTDSYNESESAILKTLGKPLYCREYFNLNILNRAICLLLTHHIKYNSKVILA